MGLAISRSIIEAHDGRLWAERRPAGGLLMRFTLPADHPVRPEPVGALRTSRRALDASKPRR
jgi:K+-sensing histidine kinase KdpD